MKLKALLFALVSFGLFFALIFFIGKEPLLPIAVVTTIILIISNYAAVHLFSGTVWGALSFASIGLLYFLDTSWQPSVDNELLLFLGWLPWSVCVMLLLLSASFSWIPAIFGSLWKLFSWVLVGIFTGIGDLFNNAVDSQVDKSDKDINLKPQGKSLIDLNTPNKMVNLPPWVRTSTEIN